MPLEKLVFGHTFTDNMLLAAWEEGAGWETPRIRPYGPLQLEPSASVLHYGFEAFEGMKAYKDRRGRVRLFRPEMNMQRLLSSARRLTLPVCAWHRHRHRRQRQR